MLRTIKKMAAQGSAPAVLIALLGLAACAAPEPHAVTAGQPAEHWVTFKDHATLESEIATPEIGVASLVFMRSAAESGPAVNVYVDGQYATSLLPGAARKIAVCAGEKRIALAFTDVGRRYEDKSPTAPAVQATLAKDEERFFQLVAPAPGTPPQARMVSAEDAARLTDTAKWQNHSLSRVSIAPCTGSARPAP